MNDLMRFCAIILTLSLTAMSNFGNNLNEYYVTLFRKNEEEHNRRLSSINTPEDARRYVSEIRAKINGIFNFPEKTPLNPRTTAIHSYQEYIMECVVFYSRPDFPVTANLYLPKNRNGRIPGVLLLCGHSRTGKAYSVYRSICIALVKKGCAVLVLDPIDQGERQQYLHDSEHAIWLTANHNTMGRQLIGCGEWFGAWRTWDAVRGLDYLQQRSEINPDKLAVTGTSGGGTLTTWLGAADPRPFTIVPGCYITSWRRNVENEIPADFEQMPPHALEYGLEMGDFLLANAPRDILILAQKKDFFDPRGAEETFSFVKKINSLLGGKTELYIGASTHGFSIDHREAMYGFITRNLLGNENPSEPEITLSPEEDTFAANGNVASISGQKWVRELANERLAALPAVPSDDKARQEFYRKLLKLKTPVVPCYRALRPTPIEKSQMFVMRFGLETETGIVMSILHKYAKIGNYSISPETLNARLYIPDFDSKSEILQRVPNPDEEFYALDMRGIGEMAPDGTDQNLPRNIFSLYGPDYHYASLALMQGRPLLGQKVQDILDTIELLSRHGARKIILEAHGLGCIPAEIAVTMCDKNVAVEYHNRPIPQSEELQKAYPMRPLSYILPR